MGIVGGVMPSPLHMIALAQVALKRWAVALFVLVGAPLIVDGSLLLVTFFFYERVPQRIAHDVAYAGGIVLIGFATFSLLSFRDDRAGECQPVDPSARRGQLGQNCDGDAR